MDAQPPPQDADPAQPGTLLPTSERERSRPATACPDPEPQPPVEPALTDCCGSGCTPCIFDLYQYALERHQAEHAAWHARNPDRAG